MSFLNRSPKLYVCIAFLSSTVSYARVGRGRVDFVRERIPSSSKANFSSADRRKIRSKTKNSFRSWSTYRIAAKASRIIAKREYGICSKRTFLIFYIFYSIFFILFDSNISKWRKNTNQFDFFPLPSPLLFSFFS